MFKLYILNYIKVSASLTWITFQIKNVRQSKIHIYNRMDGALLYILLGIVIALLIFMIVSISKGQRRNHYWPNRPIIPPYIGPYTRHGGGPNIPGVLY